MAGNANNFALLLDLAKEGSSEKRRELLRQITDVFLADPPERSDRESMLFDEIVGAVASDLETHIDVVAGGVQYRKIVDLRLACQQHGCDPAARGVHVPAHRNRG